MQTYLRKLSALPNLYAAWKKLKKKKHSRGFDDQSIDKFKRDLDRNLRGIRDDLRTGRFEFTPFLGVLHDKPGGGKRPIKIPAVRDRVILKAIQLLISHKFDMYNLPCSYGYIPGVKVADAVKRVRDLAGSGNPYVLEGDISKFFDTVDRDILMKRFVHKIRIPSLEDLISRALRVETGNLDDFRPVEREMFPMADSGIPQGGVLSPMLANFYLYPFDKAMTAAGFKLVRYADDFVVMCKTEGEARAAYALAYSVLHDQLKLEIHPLGENSKTKITLYSKGFTFLGLHFQGGRVAPSSKASQRFREKVSAITDPRQGLSLLKVLTTLKNTIDGWAHAYHGYDSSEIFQDLDRYVREEFSRFLRFHGLIPNGNLINTDQRRFFGVPSLEGIRQKLSAL
jgi:RNA-directed DNA polymerase